MTVPNGIRIHAEKEILLFLILCTCTANAEMSSADQAMDTFCGVIGHVAFALPGHAAGIREKDYPGVWKNGVQMTGECAVDGSEFQLYSADIQALIDTLTQNYPGVGQKYPPERHAETTAFLPIHIWC